MLSSAAVIATAAVRISGSLAATRKAGAIAGGIVTTNIAAMRLGVARPFELRTRKLPRKIKTNDPMPKIKLTSVLSIVRIAPLSIH